MQISYIISTKLTRIHDTNPEEVFGEMPELELLGKNPSEIT